MLISLTERLKDNLKDIAGNLSLRESQCCSQKIKQNKQNVSNCSFFKQNNYNRSSVLSDVYLLVGVISPFLQ